MTVFMGKKTKRHNKGMTLIEAMVAGTILAITMGLVIGAFQQIKQRQRYTATKQNQMWAVYYLVEEVKAGLETSTGIKEYSMSDALDNFKKIVEPARANNLAGITVGGDNGVDGLRYWSHKRVSSMICKSDEKWCLNNGGCPFPAACPGRIMWKFVPLENFPGFVLTVGISHPEIFLEEFDANKNAKPIVVYRQFVLGSE